MKVQILHTKSRFFEGLTCCSGFRRFPIEELSAWSVPPATAEEPLGFQL